MSYQGNHRRGRWILNNHIADEVTDRCANNEILLVCLCFLQLIDGEVCIQESFVDSVHIAGRATGATVGQYILDLLKKTQH